MSMLVKLEIDAQDFGLGRVFSTLNESITIELESHVPLPGATIPMVWLENGTHDSLEEQIETHPTVENVEKVESLDERSLYALEWTLEYDHFFRQCREANIHVLTGSGSIENTLHFHA